MAIVSTNILSAGQNDAAGKQSTPMGIVAAVALLLSNTGWILSGHFAAKVSRILSTLIVARLLLPEHFGIAAVALFIHELSGVAARFATTQAIVRSDDAELGVSCQAARKINWNLGFALFFIQCVVALAIAGFKSDHTLSLVLAYLAIAYLLLPFASVNAGLTLRNSRFRYVSLIEILQAFADFALTIVLALAGFGVWAIVIPKVLVIPIWIIIHRRVSPVPLEYLQVSEDKQAYSRIFNFSRDVIACELVKTLKNGIDLVLVGLFFGLEVLGIYFFAVNAGLGLTRAIVAAFNQVLFPYLCDVKANIGQLRNRFVVALCLIALIAIAIVTLQMVFASWYVPLVFGQKWVDYGAVPILTTLCIAAVPLAALESSGQLLRSLGRQALDLTWNIRFLLIMLPAVVVGANWGLQGVAYAVVLTNVICVPVLIARFVFKEIKLAEIESGNAVS